MAQAKGLVGKQTSATPIADSDTVHRLKTAIIFETQSHNPISYIWKPVEGPNEIVHPLISLVRSTGFLLQLIGS